MSLIVEPGGASIATLRKFGVALRLHALRQRHHQRHREEEQHGGQDDRAHRWSSAHVQDAPIERRKLRALFGRLRHEEIGRHQRRQQARHQQREQHRDRYREAELAEELAGNARHEDDREEHRGDGEGRRHDGKADLVGALDGGVVGTQATVHALLDVLDLDDGVVDQDADHQGQPQQRHHVQAEPQHAHEEEGRDQRHRHGDGGDQRRAPVAQEDEHDQRRQQHAFQQRVPRGDEAGAGLVHARQDLGDRDAFVLLQQLFDGRRQRRFRW